MLRFPRSTVTGAGRRVLQREQYARLLAIAAAEAASNAVSAVLKYVQGHLTEPLTVADLAEQVSLSPSRVRAPVTRGDRPVAVSVRQRDAPRPGLASQIQQDHNIIQRECGMPQWNGQ